MAAGRVWQRHCERWVIKVGSALLTDSGRSVDGELIRSLAGEIDKLRSHGCQVVLVSSGAVAAGLLRLERPRRPTDLHELQAAAAIGQSALLRHYEQAFESLKTLTAQVLLGHDDVIARDRYLNARGTLKKLLELGVVPIVNENDTVATDEIRFGDNDTLAALVANLIDADVLILLTDQPGLFDSDPRVSRTARLIEHRAAEDPELDNVVSGGGEFGRGGMVTKLRAARLAARSGTQTLIVDGHEPEPLNRLHSGEPIGTWLESPNAPQTARRQWLASLVSFKGTLVIDDGAVRVVQTSGRSLLPVGIISVTGVFSRGDVVVCKSASGKEVASGLSNYSSQELEKIIGKSSSDIPVLLGYGGEPEAIHRDNLVILR
ncbi:MAG: glutamate 5-kinase [Pseudomonadota bacterium]